MRYASLELEIWRGGERQERRRRNKKEERGRDGTQRREIMQVRRTRQDKIREEGKKKSVMETTMRQRNELRQLPGFKPTRPS
jgi:hypothetical protein